MNKITEITRQGIFNLFKKGYTEYGFSNDSYTVRYPYYGRLEEIEFIKKLYPLDKMDSDSPNKHGIEWEIRQHTINNDDWNFGWIFDDSRFELLKGSDVLFLNFLCAVFHPENRDENESWMQYLNKINYLIKIDGFELYESGAISKKSVYSWRQISPEESASGMFIPFSIRNRSALETKTLVFSISKKMRKDFINLFYRYSETQYRTGETNYNYRIPTEDAVIEDVRSCCKAFGSIKNYLETSNIEQFIMRNYPYHVFDAIELFGQYNSDNNFAHEVNLIFQKNRFAYKLIGGKIGIEHKKIQTKEIIKEFGLKDLLNRAALYYNSDKKIAVETLWDAFERLKTYYGKDKKTSSTKIVTEMSKGDSNYFSLFEDEFIILTEIGNNYRIRHHEINKFEIIDNNYYDYFYQRCFALIDLALKYLEKNNKDKMNKKSNRKDDIK